MTIYTLLIGREAYYNYIPDLNCCNFYSFYSKFEFNKIDFKTDEKVITVSMIDSINDKCGTSYDLCDMMHIEL